MNNKMDNCHQDFTRAINCIESIKVIEQLLNITIRKHSDRLRQLGVNYTNKDDYNFDYQCDTVNQAEIYAHIDYLKKLDDCFTFLDSVKK